MMKTQVNAEKNTQKNPSRVSPSKWAHLTEKTNEQSPDTDIHKLGGPLSSVQDERRRERCHPWAGQTTRSAGPISVPTGLSFSGKLVLIHSKVVHYVSILVDGGK